MNKLKSALRAFFGLLAVSLTACETGGDNSQAGISGTGQQLGSVNGFGSVIVNGVRYETDDAQIVIDGVATAEDQLSVGMVVLVNGEIEGEHDGVAERIEFDRTLCGPVESVDESNGSFVAVGITVETDQATIFVNGSMDTLQVGSNVRVSGYHGFGGLIAAGYVEVSNCTTAPAVDVEGFVEDLDAAGRRFSIGELSVEYSRAVVNQDLGVLAEGSLIEVRGTRAAAGADLVASQITVLAGQAGDPGSDLNVEGIVNSFVSESDFRIGVQPVNIDGAREKDLAEDEPADGVRMHIQGSIDENGVLVAHRYYVIPENNYRISGPINFVGNNTFQFGLMGAPRFYLPITVFDDNSTVNNPSYGPADLAIGDFVEITGYLGTSGDPRKVVSATLERIDEGDVKARGPIDSFDQSEQTVTIASVVIHTDCGNTTVCLDSNGNPATTAAFYADLSVGDVLDAAGPENSRQVTATTIGHD